MNTLTQEPAERTDHHETADLSVRLPYPERPLMKWGYKAPLLLWRLGLGFLLGRALMILTTTGRKSGEPRHTPVEFHSYHGRRYVMSGWGEDAQWYKNLLADPRVTIQTSRGTEHVLARRLIEDDELKEAFGMIRENPTLRQFASVLGINLRLEDWLANKDRLYFITFDPTDAPTPAPLPVDLTWVWNLVIPLTLALLARRRNHARKTPALDAEEDHTLWIDDDN